MILPLALGTLLVAAYKDIVGDYRHPFFLTVTGAFVVVIMAMMGGYTIINEIPKLWS
ncbi:hypothetical protein [Bacillus safensis FO-36b] [Bacillus safensis subsp. safensis]